VVGDGETVKDGSWKGEEVAALEELHMKLIRASFEYSKLEL